MGEHECAAASLWLEHAPSIGLAIGPRQKDHYLIEVSNEYVLSFLPQTIDRQVHRTDGRLVYLSAVQHLKMNFKYIMN